MLNVRFISSLPPPALTTDDVHVYAQDLTLLTSSQSSQLVSYLLIDEQARAERFLFPADRWRFQQVRGLLRRYLANYLNAEPQQVQFIYGPHGQPQIDIAHHARTVHFNLSHSQHWAVFAFTARQRVGVDIEFQRPLQHLDKMLRHLCTPTELATLHAFEPETWPTRFFQLWTRKEALLKAVGLGLHGGLRNFQIGWEPATPTQPLRVLGPEQRLWNVIDLPAETGLLMSLAVEANLA